MFDTEETSASVEKAEQTFEMIIQQIDGFRNSLKKNLHASRY